MANHVMFRSDAMAGTILGQYLASIRVGKDAIDNGMLVAVGALEAGQREVKVIGDIAATTPVGNIAVLGSEEVVKSKNYNTVGEFTNEGNSIARGYILHDGGAYSVTAGAFDGGVVPTVGAKVYAKAGAHLHTTTAEGNVEIGSCEAIETDGATVWYVIRIVA